MSSHDFITQPGTWFGEGKITLSMISEKLIFLTSWKVEDACNAGRVQCVQDVQIQGLQENMCNSLVFFNFGSGSFSVEMENPNIGKVTGSGIYDEQMLGWEFRDHEIQFEGFETYTIQEDGSYLMKAEYISSDQLRTVIEGRIWKQLGESDDSSKNEGEIE